MGGFDVSEEKFDFASYAMGQKTGGGGGASVTVEALSVTQNGTTTAPSGKAYSPVTVDVFQLESKAMGLNNLFAVSTLNSGFKPDVPENIVIVAPYCNDITGMFTQYMANATYSLGIKTVTLTLSHPTTAPSFLSKNSSIHTVTFPNGIEIRTNLRSMFENPTALKHIYGTITIQSGISANNHTSAFSAPILEDITFANGTIYESVTFNSPNLTDASLVSIANGLDGTVTGKTLTHHATAKARCGQIAGTVTEGVFAIDAQGSTTLTDFITQTKGWTLA